MDNVAAFLFVLFLIGGVGYYVFRKKKYRSAVDDPSVPPKSGDRSSDKRQQK